MIIKNFHAKIDLNQSDLLHKVQNTIIQPSNDYEKNCKIIIIQDESYQIEQEIYFINENHSFNRNLINNHLYFIRYFVYWGRRMNNQKISIHYTINCKSQNSEVFQFRKNSLLFEFIKGEHYFCLKRNKMIRKFKLFGEQHVILLGYLTKSTAICIKSKYSKNLKIIHYNIAIGKVIMSQQAIQQNHNNHILVSKNQQYMSLGDQLINIKSSEIITYFYQIRSQFSDCSNYFSFMDYQNITVFDISKKEIFYILQTSFLFDQFYYFENKYRQIFIDFDKYKLIFEDWQHSIVVEYYYQLQ